jgi:hypothetical protein
MMAVMGLMVAARLVIRSYSQNRLKGKEGDMLRAVGAAAGHGSGAGACMSWGGGMGGDCAVHACACARLCPCTRVVVTVLATTACMCVCVRGCVRGCVREAAGKPSAVVGGGKRVQHAGMPAEAVRAAAAAKEGKEE